MYSPDSVSFNDVMIVAIIKGSPKQKINDQLAYFFIIFSGYVRLLKENKHKQKQLKHIESVPNCKQNAYIIHRIMISSSYLESKRINQFFNILGKSIYN